MVDNLVVRFDGSGFSWAWIDLTGTAERWSWVSFNSLALQW